MNKDKIISLADAPGCPVFILLFYDKFKPRIAGIETIRQRNELLSEMQEDFQRRIRQEPQNRDQLSEIYQLLKRECYEVI